MDEPASQSSRAVRCRFTISRITAIDADEPTRSTFTADGSVETEWTLSHEEVVAFVRSARRGGADDESLLLALRRGFLPFELSLRDPTSEQPATAPPTPRRNLSPRRTIFGRDNSAAALASAEPSLTGPAAELASALAALEKLLNQQASRPLSLRAGSLWSPRPYLRNAADVPSRRVWHECRSAAAGSQALAVVRHDEFIGGRLARARHTTLCCSCVTPHFKSATTRRVRLPLRLSKDERRCRRALQRPSAHPPAASGQPAARGQRRAAGEVRSPPRGGGLVSSVSGSSCRR